MVLPAPFGPITACSSPGTHVERHVVGDAQAAEILAQASMRSTGSAHGFALAQPAGQRRSVRRARTRTTSTSSGPKITFQCSVRPESHSSASRNAAAPMIAPLSVPDAAEDHHDEQARPSAATTCRPG